MRTLNGKKLILWALSLILCMTACAPAFASTGDRVLLHRSNVDGDSNLYIRTAFPYGNGVYVIAQESGEDKILRYADVNAEPESLCWTRKSFAVKTAKTRRTRRKTRKK